MRRINAHSRTMLARCAAVILLGVFLDAAVRPAASTPDNPGPIVTRPSYGPGGREVAFWTDWGGKREIWAVSTVDGSLRPIVEGIEPAWSPSGSWIAFEAAGIRLVRPDGSSLRQLTTPATSRSRRSGIAWSPDGAQIVFLDAGLWMVNVDGTGLRRIPAINPNAHGGWSSPSISPDGKQLVLSEGVCYKVGAGYSCPRHSHLVIMNIDGTGRRQLTTDGFDDNEPSWGRRGILFASNRFGSWSIKIIQPDGKSLTAIPNAVGMKPAWAPDGDKFAFLGPALGIHEFDFRTGKVRPLLEIWGYLIPIEIMPGVSPKVVSLSQTPSIQVAIRPAPGFVDDPVNELDRTSLMFGRTGFEESLEGCTPAGAELLCRFKTSLTGFRTGDTVGILLADNGAGLPLEGRGTIRIVP